VVADCGEPILIAPGNNESRSPVLVDCIQNTHSVEMDVAVDDVEVEVAVNGGTLGRHLISATLAILQAVYRAEYGDVMRVLRYYRSCCSPNCSAKASFEHSTAKRGQGVAADEHPYRGPDEAYCWMMPHRLQMSRASPSWLLRSPRA
jgi:hypothetical protein